MTDTAPDPAGEDPRAGNGSRVYRRALIALFCAGMALFAQMYAPQGVLPELATGFGVSAGDSSWAIGATTIGVAIGVIPWARASDRWGRVPTMRAAMITAMALGIAAPLLPSFGGFVTVRFFEGLAMAGLPAIAVTAIAETVRPAALGAAVGTYVAGTTLGGLAGRILVAVLSESLGWRWGLTVTAVLAAGATLVFLLLIPPTVARPGPAPPTFAALRSNLRTPGVMVLIAQAFLLMGGFVASFNYLTFRLEHAPFSLSVAQASWIFLVYLAGTVASRWIWRMMGDRSPTAALLWCMGLMVLGIGLTLVQSLPVVILGMVCFTGCFFAAHAIASGLINGRAGAGRSLAPPMYNLGYYAGSSLLGWVGGIAFVYAGWPGTVTMIVGAIVCAAALACWYARGAGGMRVADRPAH